MILLDSPPRGVFKTLRILILLLVLLVVALSTWQDRYRSTRQRQILTRQRRAAISRRLW
jgi:hypothetical protein